MSIGLKMNRKIKLLFLDTPLDPPGGGQRSLLELLASIDPGKYEKTVFIDRPTAFAEMVAATASRVSAVGLSGLFPRIRALAPDLIHCNSAATRYTFAAAVCSKIFSIPFVWHVRVADRAPLRDAVIGSMSDRIVVVSDFVAERFGGVALGGVQRRKVARVYNPIDTDRFRPMPTADEVRKEFSIGQSTGIIGVFARPDRWKGRSILPAVKSELRARGLDTVFIVAGGESALPSAEEDGFIYAGYRDDIPRLMNACDIVWALTAEPEPFGRTVAEAMACAKPVMATRAGGPLEIISDGEDGFLSPFEPAPAAALAARIMQDSAMALRIGAAARAKIISKFDRRKIAAEIENIWRTALG